MKNRVAIIRQFFALLLTSSYLAFWLSASLHPFVHHKHHAQKVCSHAPNEQHIHNEEYAGGDCHVCQIVPTLAELPSCTLPLLLVSDRIFNKSVFDASEYFPTTPITLAQPRAPPACHA